MQHEKLYPPRSQGYGLQMKSHSISTTIVSKILQRRIFKWIHFRLLLFLCSCSKNYFDRMWADNNSNTGARTVFRVLSSFVTNQMLSCVDFTINHIQKIFHYSRIIALHLYMQVYDPLKKGGK